MGGSKTRPTTPAMKASRRITLTGSLATSLILAGSGSAAQPVSITNPGFETPALEDGGLQTGAVPGWSAFNGATIAVLDPSSSDLTGEAPEGENVGLITSSSSEDGFSQTLASPFQADASYSLVVKVANTKFTTGFPGYVIQLLANGTVLAEDDNSQTIAENSVVTRAVNYSYNAGLHAGLVGQSLEIRLLSKGLGSGEEIAFDDVQLSATLGNPSANPGGPYSVDHGATLSLNGGGSLPSEGQTITAYAWDLDNDGDFDEAVTGATPAAISHATLMAVPPAGYGMVIGANTIRLRVTDSAAKVSTAEGTVTLLPPVSKFTPSTVRPTLNDQDQWYFNDPAPATAGSPGDKWWAEPVNANGDGAGGTKGQSFTITGDRILKGLTYRIGNSQAIPTKVYVVRINALDPATNTLYPIHSEEITQNTDWGVGNTDAYGTWSFGTPITLRGLPAGTVYGFDIAMKSSTTAWQTGIPYPTFANTDVFTGGYKYTCAQVNFALGSATTTVKPDSGRDREFHADMESTTFTDTVTPALTSINDQVGGGPIYQDQVQVTYILNFDDAVDAATINPADLENLGSGVSINSVVSATHTTPFPIASAVKLVLGISGTGTLRLGIKSGATIADHAGHAIGVPVADDTTITVNSGTNPGAGNRWWDGTVTTGITDGVSQGGTATWNTSTTNWDRGFGFGAPVQWSNSNLATAVFGGTAGTVTLGANIIAGGITSGVNYTISGANTLTFDAASAPVVDVTANTLTIGSTIAGTNGLQKNGAGTLLLTGTNNISGGLTLNAGILTVTNSPSAFGTGTLTINGGQIRANTNGQVSTTTNNHNWNGNFTLSRGATGSATWNFNGDILLGANVSVSHSDNTITTTLAGNISDGGNNRLLTLAANSGSFTLSGNNSHGGGTRINSGTLRINHASALGTGTFTIGGASTIDNITGGPLTLAHDAAQVWNNNFTFTGTHDLNLGNGPLTLSNNSTVTVSAGTLTVGGGVGQSGGNRALTKAGPGSLVLSGANTYSGNTTVNAGNLTLAGPSQNSAITMNAATVLTLYLGAPTTSTKALTLNDGSIVRIIGTPSGPMTTYPLFATAGVTGDPVIETPIPGYDLVVINDDELRLVQIGSDLTPPTLTSIVDDKGGATIMAGTTVTYTVTLNEDMDDTSIAAADFGNAGTALVTIGSVTETAPGVFSVQVTPTTAGTLQFQINLDAVLKDLAGINLVTTAALPDDTIITVEATGYEDWATGGEPFDDDANGDGVDNGVAFLLGAAGPSEDAIIRLPTPARDGSGNLVLTFKCLPDANRGDALLYVDHSRDLGGSDPWTSSAPVTDTAGGPAVNGVTLAIIPGVPLNSVTATIDASQAEGGGKLYGRLRAVNP